MAETKNPVKPLYEELHDQANLVRQEIGVVIKGAHATGRELTEDEQKILAGYEAKLEGLEEQARLAALSEKREVDHIEGVAELHAAAAAPSPVVSSITQAEHDLHRTNGEENVYNPVRNALHPEDGGCGFLYDVVYSREHEGGESEQRLRKHMRQMRARGVVPYIPGQVAPTARSIDTGDLNGLLPPVYIYDPSATAIRPGRPTADVCRRLPMPQSGTEITLPQINTGTVAAVVAENTGSAGTDPTTQDRKTTMKTIRGHFNVSFLSMSQGVMIPDLFLRDLLDNVDSQINDQVVGHPTSAASEINGILSSASGRESLAAGNRKLDDDKGGTPGAADAYDSILKNVLTVIATTRYRRATHLIMHPRRLNQIMAAKDTTGRPLWQSAALTASNVMAVGDQGGPTGVTSVLLAGVPVIADPHVPTDVETENADPVIGIVAEEMLLMESPMMIFRGNPALEDWTHMVTAGKHVAFIPRFSTSGAYTSGTIFGASTV